MHALVRFNGLERDGVRPWHSVPPGTGTQSKPESRRADIVCLGVTVTPPARVSDSECPAGAAAAAPRPGRPVEALKRRHSLPGPLVRAGAGRRQPLWELSSPRPILPSRVGGGAAGRPGHGPQAAAAAAIRRCRARPGPGPAGRPLALKSGLPRRRRRTARPPLTGGTESRSPCQWAVTVAASVHPGYAGPPPGRRASVSLSRGLVTGLPRPQGPPSRVMIVLARVPPRRRAGPRPGGGSGHRDHQRSHRRRHEPARARACPSHG